MSVLLSISESDRRLLLILFVVIVILFFLVGLIGMLVRYINKKFAYRLDEQIHDAVRYGAITNEKDLRKYGIIKNGRLYYKQMLPAIAILLVALLFWIIYSAATDGWGVNHFERFSTVLFIFDWGNPENYATFFGITLLSKWPELLSGPHFIGEYWASYIIVPIALIGLIYYFVVSQAFVCRHMQLRKRCKTVFNKSLDGFNYYDHVNMPKSVPNTNLGNNDNKEN